MKFKKAISVVLIILISALLASCRSTTQDNPAQTPENTKQQVTPVYGDITDPVELEKLWQEYLYDSITTVGNTRLFNSAEEIDPYYIAKFAWFKYVAEHGEESLALADKDSTLRIFPLEIVLEYAGRYFNLSALDVSALEEGYYDKKRQAFLFALGSEQPRPAYNANNSWGEQLTKVTRNSDDTITAVMVRNGPPQSGRIELTKTFNLKPREDGSLYFVSGRWEYINNNLVTITGDYQRFDKIEGFTGNMDGLSMLGEDAGGLIMAYTPYNNKEKAALLLISPETMKVEKKLELAGYVEATDLRRQFDKIVLCGSDKIITIDKSLAQVNEIPLPQTINAKIARKPRYDRNGLPDIFFGGYDVSGDLQRIVYADEEGVKLFSLADNSEKLLSPTAVIEGSELMKNSYHRNPRFVDNGQKVITTMTAYEGTMGYTLCDLKEGTAKRYDISSDGSTTGLIRYDTGLLEIGVYIHDREKQTGEYKTLFLDFKTGMVNEIKLEEPGDTGYIRPPEYTYLGQDYAAFITNVWDSGDNANSKFYLNRLDLKTLQIKPKIVTVKAAQTHILGVLGDGRIVFWYEFNPSESGVCITK